MSSGGDLDGDRFLVCWDPDIVPEKIAEVLSLFFLTTHPRILT